MVWGQNSMLWEQDIKMREQNKNKNSRKALISHRTIYTNFVKKKNNILTT